ncbi:MAG: TIR domain-containing protein [Desulfobacteraceae bacterium]
MSEDHLDEVEKQQPAYIQRWIEHAPDPPERGDNIYDVFISYRSTDRAWAMALYDALKQAGWEPFLDQYILVPGSNLETSLIEALEASSSGVILWSSKTKDSDWCKKERQAMDTLSKREGSFNYVFSKLDGEPLPLFAQGDLYIDFEDSPDGPRGVNLLRLICGMRGVPLSPDAVKLAQEVDQNEQQSLVAIKAAIEAINPEQLLKLGTSSDPGLLASPHPVLAAAQGLISMGECDMAESVLKHALTCFPKSLRARQLRGLVLRRQKRYQDAINVLSELKAAGHKDPETLGILAAAWDGKYQESGKSLYLRKSRELYREAFETDPTDYYTGINTASKSLFLNESEVSEKFAAEVYELVKQSADGKDFWAACTLAEVYLLKKKFDSAEELFQRIIDRHFSKSGDLEGTRLQAIRICIAHGLSEAETARVLKPFDILES